MRCTSVAVETSRVSLPRRFADAVSCQAQYQMLELYCVEASPSCWIPQGSPNYDNTPGIPRNTHTLCINTTHTHGVGFHLCLSLVNSSDWEDTLSPTNLQYELSNVYLQSYLSVEYLYGFVEFLFGGCFTIITGVKPGLLIKGCV